MKMSEMRKSSEPARVDKNPSEVSKIGRKCPKTDEGVRNRTKAFENRRKGPQSERGVHMQNRSNYIERKLPE